MAETLRLLAIISFSVAGVCLGLAVFFWFFFKIPGVIGDLTGRTARKSIAKMRAANEKAGAKGFKESKTNVGRGKLTGAIPNTPKTEDRTLSANERPETGILTENKADDIESEETGMLDSEATGLLQDDNATVPRDNSAAKKQPERVGGVKLRMLDDVVFIHTDEVIE